MASLGEDFVRLALAIDQHLPGYVDSFFGPAEWNEQAKREGRIPLPVLTDRSAVLYREIAGSDAFEAQRKAFLLREMQAMKMSLRLLAGEKISLAEEVNALYDVTPTWKSESVFEEAHRELGGLLPAGGGLNERMLILNKSLELTNDKLRELLPYIIQKLRVLTHAKFNLPEGEDFTLEFVTEKPWSAYNWYHGNFHSLIDLNIDLPIRLNILPDLIAHEGYPGHHTELCIKEARLINELGYPEFTVNLINAPSCVVNEGIATCALDRVMSENELKNWYREELLPRAGLSHIGADRLLAINKALDKTSGLVGNAAFMLHDQGIGTEEISRYLQRYGLLTEKQAERSVKFITNPLYRSYVFTYHVGRELLNELFKHGDPDRYFARLLEEPVSPTMIRAWIGAQ